MTTKPNQWVFDVRVVGAPLIQADVALMHGGWYWYDKEAAQWSLVGQWQGWRPTWHAAQEAALLRVQDWKSHLLLQLEQAEELEERLTIASSP